MSNTPTLYDDSELRDDILAFLKKAYFNARTDVVAEANGLVEKGSPQALPILNNLTDDLLQLIHQHDEARDKQLRLTEDQVEQANFRAGLMSDYPNHIRVQTKELNDFLIANKMNLGKSNE